MKTQRPFEQTLYLVPKSLHLGIGCRKGSTREAIEAAVTEVLEQNHLDRKALAVGSSIDLKAGEAGLLEFGKSWGLPLRFYTAEELLAVPGKFTASAFVESVTGVDNVCERAALLGAARLLMKKTARDGVTVAVAEEEREVRFE